MQVFLDDLAVFSTMDRHLEYLPQFLQWCRHTNLKLNPARCAFAVTGDRLLGHIFNRKGITIDSAKVEVVLSAPRPTNAKGRMRFLGQVHWRSCVLCHLAEFAQPLHVTSHTRPF